MPMLERVDVGMLASRRSCIRIPAGRPSAALKKSPLTPATVALADASRCIAVTRSRPPPKPRVVHPHQRPVPILEYHVVGTPPADAPFPELYVGRSDFAAQLQWLRRQGYQPVSLGRVYDYWTRGYALPSRPVVLSFD